MSHRASIGIIRSLCESYTYLRSYVVTTLVI